ncbi:MAG TPA: hypothetical protein VEA60_10640 [Allosphingosinicella sp.]|nr:hypothetical protein [Allosphingosinicella sp.]
MSFLGLFGIIIGFFAIPVAFTHATRVKVAYMALIYLIHVAASVVYFWRALENQGDSDMYYYDPYQTYEEGFNVGTQALIYVTQYIKSSVGGTYLDFFLLFQAIGFLGIMVLLRIFEEIHDELRLPHRPYLYALIAIPSLHFWSSALGKDGPFLLATSLAIWAAMRLPKRAKALAGALLLMLLIRPHIALVAAAALSLAVIVGKGIPAYVRVVLFLVALVGTGLAASTLESTYAIDITSAESIGKQFERRDNVLQSEEAGSTAVDAPFPIRLLSLMFRPFFFDAYELFALIASFESMLVIAIVIMLAVRSSDLLGLFRTVFFARYALIFAIGMTIFLALSYWNVGLGLRQKWTMLMPMYLVLFVAVLAVRRAKTRGLEEVMAVDVLNYPSAGPPRPAVQAPYSTL